MKAWVIHEPGGPEKFRLEDMPGPEPRPGWALMTVRSFGLNRSEWFARRGASPTVRFPRVLGIECVGAHIRAHRPMPVPFAPLPAERSSATLDRSTSWAF